MSDSNSIPMPTDPRFQDLTGRVYTRLTVLGYAGKIGKDHVWNCLCACGVGKVVRGECLKRESTRSCGCLSREVASMTMARHGWRYTKEYTAWGRMWSRCTNTLDKNYQRYAGRRPPDAWRDFEVFLADVGPMTAPGLTLDRIDNDKPYGPGNCRWVSMKVQANNRGGNVLYTLGGVTLTQAQWAERVGVRPSSLRYRLASGWPLEKALTTPVR